MTTGPHESRALQALTTSASTADATTFALRYGLARRPGRGLVAGVCTALVAAYGVPVRLLRTFMVVLALLGPGLFLYLTLFLLLPRVPVSDKDSEAPETFDIPARSLAKGKFQPGDLVVTAALLPAVVFAVAAVWVYTTRLQIVLAFLLPIVLMLGLVLGMGAWRTSRARTTYFFAMLGRRAGIVGDKELWRTIDDLRSEAPRAWARSEDETGDPSATIPRNSPKVPTWQVGVRLTAFMATALALYSLVSFFPSLLPWVDPDGPLAGLTRAGAVAGLVGLGIGISLVAWAIKGKRCPQFVVWGLVCTLCFGSAVAWSRLTDSRESSPIRVEVTEYEPGALIECQPGGLRQWNRPVVIDMSKLEAPPSAAAASKAWDERNSGGDPAFRDLSMTLSCSRAVGDVTVILPKHQWSVETGLTTALGAYDTDLWQGYQNWDPSKVSIKVIGELGAGDIRYEKGMQ